MIGTALLAASILAAPAKAPAVPKPETAVFAVSECAGCREAPAVVAGGAPGTFTVQWEALTDFQAFRPAAGIGVGHPALAAVGEQGRFVLVWREGERNLARVFRP